MSKKIININRPDHKSLFTMKEMYLYYKKIHPDSTVSYLMFSEVLGRYNKKLKERLFRAEKVTLGSGLGVLSIKRVNRKFIKPRIDWYETNKLKKEEGINKYVYYTDDYWYRFSWLKGQKLPNKSVYKFTCTKGANGIVKDFIKCIKNDPFLEEKFIRR